LLYKAFKKRLSGAAALLTYVKKSVCSISRLMVQNPAVHPRRNPDGCLLCEKILFPVPDAGS